MTGDKVIRDKRGLTLMELLVVMGVFSMTVAMTSAIFIQSNRAQRRVISLTATQADLRFAMEAIVREVRGGQINYAAYEGTGGIQIPSDNLMLISANGNKLKFYIETDKASPAVCPTGVIKCLAVNVTEADGIPHSQSITSAGITLQNLTFFISPQGDPFSLDAASGLYKGDSQPLVTISMKVKSTGSQNEGFAILSAQTTVASRTYAR